MKLKNNICTCLLLLACSFAFAQVDQYNYKREIQGVSGQWHKIVLPDEIFGNVSNDLHDIRIYGITSNQDTIEAPYLLQPATEKVTEKQVSFKVINSSYNQTGYFYTLEVATKEPINQLQLEFAQPNFDWQLKLEGSHNQQEWFTIVEDYRILSIRNELTNYQFTKVTFSSSSYRYFRLHIPANEKPELQSAKIALHTIVDGRFRKYVPKKVHKADNRKTKQTEIEIDLEQPVPVNRLNIEVKDQIDYYRPITVNYLADSFKTEKGWKYSYRTLTSGTLSSMEANELKFSSTILRKLKVVIQNHDNQPLTIGAVEAKGYVHELVARFNEPANYILVYGNSKATKPYYDIERFADKVPKQAVALQLGAEQIIAKAAVAETEPLFMNKAWLWSIMTGIILLIGWFSVRMMRKA